MVVHIYGYPVSANVSLLSFELPYFDRFTAAAAAGFSSVETWWPFATPEPRAREVDAFVAAITGSGVTLTGLNFWAGDMPGGERGVASLPAREPELLSNIPFVIDIAQRTGCRAFNLLYGCTDPAQLIAGREQASRMICTAADAVGAIGGTVLIEPLADGLNGSYPLHTVEDVIHVIDSAGSPENVAVLFDLFHLASNGVDLPATARAAAPRIGHVQFADAPGRGEPGSGGIPMEETFLALRQAGYAGTVAAEYKPTRATLDTLGWADR